MDDTWNREKSVKKQKRREQGFWEEVIAEINVSAGGVGVSLNKELGMWIELGGGRGEEFQGLQEFRV